MIKRILGGVLGLLLTWQASAAGLVDPVAAKPRPRIGVVLGGGGARGFAHLGVLMELERLHIPVACISGTSAGALIGGMYANGLSLPGMKEAFRKADWDGMLSGRAKRRDMPYDRKRNDFTNYFDLTLGVREGELRVPRSAINSQEIDLFIRKLTRDSTVDSFDHLPIPFRAVATDLSNGEAVVFDHGDLSVALRASMAVPGLFDLVEHDGRLLVDGGVARNLPVQDLKNRCADRVIVVDVSTPLLKKDEINSLFDVVSQTSNLMIARNVKEQMALLGKDDIVIRPNLEGYSAASFGDNQAIMERGLTAARAMEGQLKALSVPEAEYDAWHETLVAPTAPEINRIEIKGTTEFVNRDALDARLKQHGNGEDVAEVRATLRRLFAEGDYDRLTYSISHQNGRNIMSVMPVERSTGPDYLRFGMELKGTSPGDSSYNFMVSHQRTWINSAGASWRNEVTLGNDPLFHSEFYQPFSATSPFFVAGYGEYNEKSYGFYYPTHVKALEIGVRELVSGVDAGVALGRYGEFRLGTYASRYRPFRREGSDDSAGSLSMEAWNDNGVRALLVIDQFDNPRWPRQGYFLNSEVRVAVPAWGGYDGRYYNVTAEQVSTFGDISLRLTGKVRGNIMDSAGKRTVQPQFLGGFLNLTGYQQNELVGERVALARLMGYWRVATLPSALGSGLYAGTSLEAGKVWGSSLWLSPKNNRLLHAGAVFLGADTLIGPVLVGIGSAQGGRLTGYFMVGVNY